jgi:hydroxylamine reductase
MGVCGKTDEVAGIQDLIVYATRGLALTALEAEKKGLDLTAAGRTCAAALFSTVTNVNFDKDALLGLLHRIVDERKALAARAGLHLAQPVCVFEPAPDAQGLAKQAEVAWTGGFAPDPDDNSLARTLLFGLKGVCAYTDHAAVLGHEDAAHYKEILKELVLGFDGHTPARQEWLDGVLACGRAALRSMELLDAANTETYGHPEPTPVSLKPRPGKAILVTGHDLKDLHDLLVQTEGKGINIYTHGEMLPTHAYPGLKKYPHFAGHFGTAWQNQVRELPDFPGPVLFTTNCIQRPSSSYADHVFTTGLVGWPGTVHVKNGDFGPIIERALAMQGFTDEQVARYPDVKVLVGFGHKTILNAAEALVAGVKSGAIRHFFLVGGCDGARPGRNYYTEFVEKTPGNTLVLTLACGKFRFFDKQLGEISGIPRLLDVGQCNDAHSAIKAAQALAQAFSCGVNELPLSLILSWYEQKAVAVLLALLASGIKGMRLGPTLPAFLSPNVLQILVDTFAIKPIGAVEEDLRHALGAASK